jgi:hypothetical protein
MAGRLFDVSRRAMLKTSVMGGAFAALPAFAARAADAAAESSSMSAVVDTAGGKVRGVQQRRPRTAWIPHGASTAGASASCRRRAGGAVSGVRDAFQSGRASPQVPPPPGRRRWLRGYGAGRGLPGPDVFSTGVNDPQARDDVIHGGGYL